MGGDALLPALGCHGRQPPFKNFNHRNVQFRFFTLHFSETYNTFLQFESLLTTILLLHLPFPRNLYHPCSRVLDPKLRMAGDSYTPCSAIPGRSLPKADTMSAGSI